MALSTFSGRFPLVLLALLSLPVVSSCSGDNGNCRQVVVPAPGGGTTTRQVCGEVDAGPADSGAVKPCEDDSECMGLFNICEGGRCVACRDDSNCFDPTPYCISGNRCGACRNDLDCAEGSLCTSSGLCSQCTLSCGGYTPYCALVNGIETCVECLQNDNCVLDLNKPVCDPTDKKCYQCNTVNDCPEGYGCDFHVCYRSEILPCDTSMDCIEPHRPFCISKVCEACGGDADCAGNQICIIALGRPLCAICATNADCPANYNDCRGDGVCCGEDAAGATECIGCRDDGDCLPTEVCERRNNFIACWPKMM